MLLTSTNGTVVHSIIGVDIEEWRLENSRREYCCMMKGGKRDIYIYI